MSIRTQYRRKKELGLCKPVKKHFFNEEFFQKRNNEFWWLLGLIWSDGNLFRNTIEICSKDLQLMQICINLISYKSGVLPKNNGKHYRIYFSSKKMANTLQKYGLTPNKSLTIEYPNRLPKKYEWHFIRGVFDGDGYMGISKTRKGQQAGDLRFGICSGSYSFLRSLKNVFDNYKIISFVKNPSKKRVGVIKVVKQSSLKIIFNKMYKNNNGIRLERKHKIFSEWINTKRVRVGRPAMPSTKG